MAKKTDPKVGTGKKPKLAKKFGYDPNRMVAKKGGRAKKGKK